MNVVNEVLAWLTDPAQWSGPDGIPVRTLQHLWYSVLATVIAGAIALPIGVYIGHTGRGALIAVNLTNLGRAIPSLGIIILMFTLVGFGIVPVLVALVALAVPPIVTNSYIGVRSVDRDVRDAAEGMGMRAGGVLFGVEVPLGLALVVSGIRSAASQVIATATIIAYGGLGGLGRFIIDGYSTQDYGQVYGGAVLVAGLARAAEAVLALSQRAAARRRAPSSRGRPVTVDPNLDLLRQVSDAPSPAAYPP